MMRLLKYLWSGPHTFVGLILAVAVYRAGRYRWWRGTLECTSSRSLIGGNWVDAQTHGIVIIYRDEMARSNIDLRAHEREHVMQGMKWGPLFVVSYIAMYLINLVRYRDHYAAYWDIYWEREARKTAWRKEGED